MVNIIVTKCAPQNISVGEENNQDIVPVAMQEEIKISLPENPSTGYAWNVTAVDGMTIAGDAFVPSEQTIVGVGGMRVWSLKPNAAGIAIFSAEYVRPQQGIRKEEQTYSIQFYVAPVGTSVADVSIADNGTTIPVSKGDAVLVALDENPTTGFRWAAAVLGSANIAADSFVPPTEQMPGKGGVRKWLVDFSGNPFGSFDAGYSRPMEEIVSDENSFSISFAGV
ncbi:protease inhibitor I42 family protein [Methanogenium cariaci]|jgi:predicted secreted protein